MYESDPDEPSSGSSSSTAVLVPRPSSSAVWNFFTRISDLEGKCNTCLLKLKTPSKSTTALIRHLQAKHKNVHQDFLKKSNELLAKREEKKSATPRPSSRKQPKIGEMFETKEKRGANHPKAKAITEKIGIWMAKSLHPYHLVEEEGFVDLMHTLESNYQIPTRTTFSRSVIPNLYSSTKSKLMSTLKEDLNTTMSVSLTTDLWTSGANTSFIAVTCHYVNANFEVKSFCLQNSFIPDEHTGQNIFMKLNEITSSWGIFQNEKMPIYCITDNGRNIVSALHLTEWTHLRCFAHTLQLALNDAKNELPGMKTMLTKARSIVGHYKHSSTAQNRLNKLQVQLGLTQTPLTVIQDCETRWNSEFKMLSRLVTLKQAISADISSLNKPENLSSMEWDLADNYVKLLKPLDDATTLSSSSLLPTLSGIIPLLDGMNSVIKKFISSNLKGVMFARALDRCIKSRFPLDEYSRNKTCLLAMTTDPRYKVVVLDKFEKTFVASLLAREAIELAKIKPNSEVSSQAPSTSSEQQIENEQGGSGTENFSLWENFETLTQKRQSSESTLEESSRLEVEHYLKVPTINMKENPFVWWQKNKTTYSMLGLVARKYLGIPATEVASERIFSGAGNVVNERRRRLTQEHVEELVFLHHNLP